MALQQINYTQIRGGIPNVKDFGATGDGSTDDTTSIQNAIDAATNGVIVFPYGTYLVSTLNIPNYITIEGNGSILKQSDSYTGTLLNISGSGNVQTSKNCTINNLQLYRTSIVTNTYGIVYPGPSIILNNVRTEGFDVGVYINQGQFGSAYSLKTYRCNVGLYLKPTLTGGGSNSWSFYDHQGISCVIAAVLINNQSTYPEAAIYFRNPSWLSNGGVALAVFNAQVFVDGGSPEGNANSMSSTETYDSLTIKKSSIYTNNTNLTLINLNCAEATVTPFLYLENNSTTHHDNSFGYGLSTSGQYCETDSTSFITVSGDVSVITSLGNTVLNGTISSIGNFGTVYVAQDNTYNTSSFTNEATSPLTSSLSNINGTTTSTTGYDSNQGSVGIVTFNDAGNQDTNRVRFAQITNGNYCIIGISLKSDVNTIIKFGVYGSTVQGSQKSIQLYANQWVRVYHVIGNSNISAGSYYVMYSSDGVVANISLTKLMIKSSTTSNAKLFQDFNAVLSGAYNPNIGAVNYSRANTSYPSSGTWNVGDVVYNTSPASGGYIGWVCTTAGTPGTWKTFGLIS